MRYIPIAAALALAGGLGAAAAPPNIVYILADDLGYGELGCYGQTKIRTPHIDRLAAEGMRFTQHYSGSPVCAPSRCTLLTGLHTGHAYVRANKEMGGWGPDEPEGQLALPAGTPTIAALLKTRGYATCVVGKWGLGGPASSGHPNAQGFDHWYGHLCQRVAHNHYPTHLWRNGDKDMLANDYFAAHQKITEPPATVDGYDRYAGADYAGDKMADEALAFIRRSKDGPFFLYYASPVPHVAIQVPDDSLAPYLEAGWDDAPYLGQKGYLPHPAPRAGYAAMITRLDRDVGRIVALLDELGLRDDTIVMFTSDNGPTFNGGTDSKFFDSAGPLRGLKGSVYEGGIRVPLVASWPGRIPAGTTSDHVSAFWDMLPTFCALAGAATPPGLDGISMTPTLLGQGEQRDHQLLYWELRGQQALRAGNWKCVRRRGQKDFALYDLATDIAEKKNLASSQPAVMQRMMDLIDRARVDSTEFPLTRE